MNDSKANWIWYPGDFELMLFNKCMSLRFQRDILITPFWKMDTHYANVKFLHSFTLTKPNTIRITAEGQFNVFIEQIGYMHYDDGFTLPAGKYDMSILVNNNEGLPCICVESEEIFSGAHFNVTCQDHNILPVGYWDELDSFKTPNTFSLDLREYPYVEAHKVKNGTLYDFGKEIIAFIKFSSPDKFGVHCCFGESETEALDTDNCEQFYIADGLESGAVSTVSKAFRYLYIESDSPEVQITALEEVTPNTNRSIFRCEDEILQSIWDTSVYTLDINAREFFLDGAKRDRWSWAGDAYQSALLNYYCFFNNGTVKRTISALGGKERVVTHINHIMDYTMYWVLTVCDYYLYTGDAEYIRMIYPRVKEYIEFCLNRRNDDGFLYYIKNDWVFVDWATMDNEGEVSFEQILFVHTLERFAGLSETMGEGGTEYRQIAKDLLQKTFEVFFKDGKFYHGRKDGVLSNQITKYANIFAILFGYVNQRQTKFIVENVLLNEQVQKITTPYMMFYELAAMCVAGKGAQTLDFIKSYWGGMLNEGSTTFWEKYDPSEKGVEKYAMYGRAYGKSLCHAWGATPVYLIAKYLLGIEPLEAGYDRFALRPKVDILPDLELTVPVKEGSLRVELKGGNVTVETKDTEGILYLPSKMFDCGGYAIFEKDGEVAIKVNRNEIVRIKKSGNVSEVKYAI